MKMLSSPVQAQKRLRSYEEKCACTYRDIYYECHAKQHAAAVRVCAWRCEGKCGVRVAGVLSFKVRAKCACSRRNAAQLATRGLLASRRSRPSPPARFNCLSCPSCLVPKRHCPVKPRHKTCPKSTRGWRADRESIENEKVAEETVRNYMRIESCPVHNPILLSTQQG